MDESLKGILDEQAKEDTRAYYRFIESNANYRNVFWNTVCNLGLEEEVRKILDTD